MKVLGVGVVTKQNSVAGEETHLPASDHYLRPRLQLRFYSPLISRSENDN